MIPMQLLCALIQCCFSTKEGRKKVVLSSAAMFAKQAKYRHTSFYCALQMLLFFFFYKLKARPFHQQKIMTSFTVILDLLQWSGTKPAISPRCACN